MERTMARTALSSIDEFMGLVNQEKSHLEAVIHDKDCKKLLATMKSFLRDGDGGEDAGDFYAWKKLQRFTYRAEAATVDFLLATASRSRRRCFKKLGAHLKIHKMNNQISKPIKRKYTQWTHKKAHKDVLREMKRLSTKIDRLKTRFHPQPHWNWIRSSFEFDEARSPVVGLSCEIDSLKKLLRCEIPELPQEISNLGCRGKLPRVISILGIRGIGKTKLAREIYNEIGDGGLGFQHYAWVCASAMEDDFDKIWEDVCEQIEEPSPLDGHLIVIDDVSDLQFCEKLEEKITTITGDQLARRCWIILTTRDAEVAAWAQRSIRLKVLSERESWELFKSRLCIAAPWQLGKENPEKEKEEEEEEEFRDYSPGSLPISLELEALGKEMVGKCGGIPLLITELANLLSTKRANRVEWLCALHGTDTRIGHRWFNLSSCLDDILPSHVKHFLRLFPRGTKIPSRRLMQSWFVQNGSWDDDEIAMRSWLPWVQELEFLNFIHASQASSVGIKKYSIPDLPLLQIFSKAAAAASSSGVDANDDDDDDDDDAAAAAAASNSEFRWIHRIADNYNSPGLQFRQIHDHLTSSASEPYRTLSSFWCFNYPGGYKPGQEVGSFLWKCIDDNRLRLLRVLDLEGVYKPWLPKAIGDLFNLRYLGLRWTYLDTLPPSVGELQNLRTLDAKHTEICYYPKIRHMEKLQHLYLNERHPSELVKQLPHLTHLQTLSGVIVDDSSPMKNGLDNLTNLTKLRLTCRFSQQQQHQKEAMARWIGKLSHLEALKLTSIDDHQDGDSPSSTAALSFLWAKSSVHSKLSRVYLKGQLEKLDNITGNLASNLTALTLSFTNLTVDPMPELGSLPNLILLRLFSKSFHGNKMCCSAGTFKELRVLKIWKLPDLEGWTVEKGAMPVLEELEIRSCHKLLLHNIEPEVPNSCRVLKLTDMPRVFTNDLTKVPNSCRVLKLTDMPTEFTNGITKKYHENVLHMSSIIIEKRSDSLNTSVELYTGQVRSLEELLDLEKLKSDIAELTLSGTKLKQNQISELGKLLPKLRVLILSSNSFSGKHMVFSKGEFSQLQKLTIKSLDELEKLTVNDGAMPKLENLRIKSCKNLKKDLPQAVQLNLLRSKISSSKKDLPLASLLYNLISA